MQDPTNKKSFGIDSQFKHDCSTGTLLNTLLDQTQAHVVQDTYSYTFPRPEFDTTIDLDNSCQVMDIKLVHIVPSSATLTYDDNLFTFVDNKDTSPYEPQLTVFAEKNVDVVSWISGNDWNC